MGGCYSLPDHAALPCHASLQRYCEARRLEFALAALERLPLFIEEISGRVGFAATAAFIRWMRRTGRNPSHWRKAEGAGRPPLVRLSESTLPLAAACA